MQLEEAEALQFGHNEHKCFMLLIHDIIYLP